MSEENAAERRGAIPVWLGPWLIPLLIVVLVVAAAVNLFVLVAVALVPLGILARWRYLEVRQRELGGVHEWERWRTDAMLRRAAEKYNDRR
jgi:hypothetical protein